MKAKECLIWCQCNKGVMYQTALANPNGIPVTFWVTEDENILFRGYCSHCGEMIEFIYPIMQLFLDVPNKEIM